MRAGSDFRVKVLALVGVLAGPLSAWAEGWGGRLSYTVFASDNLSKLERGDVLGKRATLERMPNAMAVQSCFLAPVEAEKAALALLNWDPSKFPELGVRLHRPVSVPARLEDFAALRLMSEKASDRVMLERSLALAGGSLVQFLSRGELDWFSKFRNDPADAWRHVLHGRAARYQASGLKEMPPYDNFKPAFKVQAGWQQLVSQTPEVTRRFIDLLQISLNEPRRNSDSGRQKYYWEVLTVQGETTFLTGAINQLPAEGSVRTADLQFYVTSHFGTALILHEMWPVMWNGNPATLVWRGDFVILPEAVTGQGIERMASENLLLQEVRRAVAAFLRSCRQDFRR